MALIAMTTADTVDYVSDLDPAKVYSVPEKGEKPKFTVKPGATVFKLRSLDVFLKGHIYDNASQMTGKSGSDEVGIVTRVNQTNIETVRHGLAGIENFKDAKGADIPFSTQKAVVNGRNYDVVADGIMNKLGIRLVQELAAQIKDISEVKGDEEKNSAGA